MLEQINKLWGLPKGNCPDRSLSEESFSSRGILCHLRNLSAAVDIPYVENTAKHLWKYLNWKWLTNWLTGLFLPQPYFFFPLSFFFPPPFFFFLVLKSGSLEIEAVPGQDCFLNWLNFPTSSLASAGCAGTGSSAAPCSRLICFCSSGPKFCCHLQTLERLLLLNT